VIAESREITPLGRVVASAEGLKVLLATNDLRQADIAAGGLLERLLTRLNNARTNLVAAAEDHSAFASNVRVQELLAACRKALEGLRSPNAKG